MASRRGVSVRPTIAEYTAELGPTIEENFTINLPAGWLIEGLRMRLKDGRSMLFQDERGRRIFHGSIRRRVGTKCCSREEGRISRLSRGSGSGPVWEIAGEKNVYGPRDSTLFGGRYLFTRPITLKGRSLFGHDRHGEWHDADEDQLRDFLMVMAS